MRIIAITGLPLSGKSTLGKNIEKSLKGFFIDIDRIAEVCAPPQEKNPQFSNPEREGKRMAIAYQTLHFAVQENLQKELAETIIISATYSRKESRDLLRKAVTTSGGGKLIFIHCQVDKDEAETRLKKRLENNEIGGCRSIEHWLKDQSRFENYSSEEKGKCFIMNSKTQGKEIIDFIINE